MIISIDTTKDTKEDIKKAIHFLTTLTNDSAQRDFAPAATPDLGLLFTEEPKEEKPSVEKQENPKIDEEIRIIPY
jgi:hypothetical protein